jgi:hypothetical protein
MCSIDKSKYIYIYKLYSSDAFQEGEVSFEGVGYRRAEAEKTFHRPLNRGDAFNYLPHPIPKPPQCLVCLEYAYKRSVLW